MSQPLALTRSDNDGALLSVLKGLEIQKTLGTDPVLTALRHFPAQPAQVADFPEGLHPKLRETLVGRGYQGLYTHQREAYEQVQAGKDVVVVTPTASGKTLCYNLPVLDRILKDPDARALYLFPTKALAQDQLAELHGVIEAIGADIGTFTYDGDTPQDARKAIRARAHVVVTNPDMLHKGILPHHTKWVKLLENLRYVVVDELHSLRGVYGSHVTNIFRRLRRLCEFYGSRPQFICSSATIGNPKELAEALTGARDDPGGRERRPPRRAVLRDLQPAGREPPARHPQVGPQLGPGRVALVPLEGAADDRLRPLAPRHRDPRDVSQGSARDEAGLGGDHPRLPWRLPAPQAAGDRAGAARGVGARRRLHERARARDRHREPRRGGARGLPGQRRLGLAAGGAGRAAHGHVGRRPRRELHPPQPVHREEPRLLLRRAGRAGPHQPGQPADPRQPRQVRGLRAALRRRRALRQGEPPRDPEVPRGGEAAAPRRETAGTGRATATRPTRSASARCPPTTS